MAAWRRLACGGVAWLVLVAPSAHAQSAGVERELADAKTLYDAGRFEEAIPKLVAVVAQLQNLQQEKRRTADAHFLLGLSYFAMRDEVATLANFRQVLALDPQRTIDADVFSPRIVALFERVRLEARTASPAGEGAAVSITGSLAIATDPEGAAVYLDGRAAGTTPLEIEHVAAGDHHVRIVKSGYLDNARVVTVVSGRATPVTVKLTESVAPADQMILRTGRGGGSLVSNKWFWIAVAGGGGATATVLATANAAPVAGTISAPATALMATSVSFSSQGASDKDGQPLTRTWDFGDGGSATGERVTHTYTTAGNFTVKLTVSDGKKSVEAPPATITIKSLSGTWRGSLVVTNGTLVTVLNLTQNSTSISGSYTDQLTTSSSGPGTVVGAVNDSGTITFTVEIRGINPFTFRGTVSADGNTLTGVINGSGFLNDSWSLTRA